MRIRGRLDSMGIAYDTKPIRPHITIIRDADISGLDMAGFLFTGSIFSITRVTLFSSRHTGGRLTYAPL